MVVFSFSVLAGARTPDPSAPISAHSSFSEASADASPEKSSKEEDNFDMEKFESEETVETPIPLRDPPRKKIKIGDRLHDRSKGPFLRSYYSDPSRKSDDRDVYSRHFGSLIRKTDFVNFPYKKKYDCDSPECQTVYAGRDGKPTRVAMSALRTANDAPPPAEPPLEMPAPVSLPMDNQALKFVGACNAGDCRRPPANTRELGHYNTCGGGVTMNSCRAMSNDGTYCSNIDTCSTAFIMDVELANALRDIFPVCVKEAAQTAYGYSAQRIQNINIVHSGALVVRRIRGGSNWSSHAYGTAVDIRQITLNLTDGAQTPISMHETKQSATDRTFYAKFGECWERSGGTNNCCCYLGSDHENPQIRNQHKDHMHLTYRCDRGERC